MVDINNDLLYYGISVKVVQDRIQMIGGFKNDENKNRGKGLLTKYWGIILTII